MITQSELKEITKYNPDTGKFVYMNHPSNRCFDGLEVGTVHKAKCGICYKKASFSRKTYQVHRLIYLYMTGSIPDGDIDHKNGDGLDNRRVNLRDVSRSVNRRNSRLSSNNTSGVCGVSWHKRNRAWEVKLNRKTIGFSKNLFDAVCLRLSAQNRSDHFTDRHGK